ncbi:hypothetical protein [Bradyrhizobium sp. USDA 3458]|uniref:hypothetical protein n=1 Tax=Bradyrhizobium sp. USDA 3458 TaxID=2591461 RepID=UPI001144F828|nr:hypothetical protein [Bradyrhizobium sp. USDA 3458]
MTVIQIAPAIVFGMIFAVALERLLRQYCKRLRDDNARMIAARDALVEQQRLADAVADDPVIPYAVKCFVLDMSFLASERAVAEKLADWIDAGMPANVAQSPDEVIPIFDQLRELNRSHPQAFEAVTGALRGAMIAAVVQWPSTAAKLFRAAHRISAESTTEVAASAVAVHRAAKTNHWLDIGAVPA